MREIIDLACTACKQRNYSTMKNKKNDPDRLERNKFCKFCRKHTPHKEGKEGFCAAQNRDVEVHGVNGSTSVSKTESLGSNPSAPATPSLLVPAAIRCFLADG